nr:SDR family oxidoreductase [Mucilaginibacter sp. L294]
MMEHEQKTKLYHIAVLGANGGIGKHAVLCALKAGHMVTAILRTPANLTFVHPNLNVVQGDVMKQDTLEEHLKGKDVVISAIGKSSFKKTTLYSEGNKNLIDAMARVGINRAFFISASGLDVNPSHSFLVRFATKFILQVLLRNMYADLRQMEKIIKESNLNWTIMRPPQLTDGPETGTYRIAIHNFLNNGLKISRADVALFIINNLMDAAITKKTIEIGY